MPTISISRQGRGRTAVFDARFKGHVEISAPLDAAGHALLLAARKGSAHIELDPDGIWRHCAVTLDSARFGRGPDYLFLGDDSPRCR